MLVLHVPFRLVAYFVCTCNQTVHVPSMAFHRITVDIGVNVSDENYPTNLLSCEIYKWKFAHFTSRSAIFHFNYHDEISFREYIKYSNTHDIDYNVNGHTMTETHTKYNVYFGDTLFSVWNIDIAQTLAVDPLITLNEMWRFFFEYEPIKSIIPSNMKITLKTHSMYEFSINDGRSNKQTKHTSHLYSNAFREIHFHIFIRKNAIHSIWLVKQNA